MGGIGDGAQDFHGWDIPLAGWTPRPGAFPTAAGRRALYVRRQNEVLFGLETCRKGASIKIA